MNVVVVYSTGKEEEDYLAKALVYMSKRGGRRGRGRRSGGRGAWCSDGEDRKRRHSCEEDTTAVKQHKQDGGAENGEKNEMVGENNDVERGESADKPLQDKTGGESLDKSMGEKKEGDGGTTVVVATENVET